jgi:hypothetical protein
VFLLLFLGGRTSSSLGSATARSESPAKAPRALHRPSLRLLCGQHAVSSHTTCVTAPPAALPQSLTAVGFGQLMCASTFVCSPCSCVTTLASSLTSLMVCVLWFSRRSGTCSNATQLARPLTLRFTFPKTIQVGCDHTPSLSLHVDSHSVCSHLRCLTLTLTHSLILSLSLSLFLTCSRTVKPHRPFSHAIHLHTISFPLLYTHTHTHHISLSSNISQPIANRSLD